MVSGVGSAGREAVGGAATAQGRAAKCLQADLRKPIGSSSCSGFGNDVDMGSGQTGRVVVGSQGENKEDRMWVRVGEFREWSSGAEESMTSPRRAECGGREGTRK